MGFKENLRSELDYSGMLVKELAAKTGIKKGTIDNYLCLGERKPTAENVVRIARVLGVSAEYLITGNETPEKGSSMQFSQEIRKTARILENLTPAYRRIAIAFIDTLKKDEDTHKAKETTYRQEPG